MFYPFGAADVLNRPAAAKPTTREHRIATHGSEPYIIALGTEQSGPRAIIVISDGRVFFSEHDAGQIGEIVPANGYPCR